MKSSIRASGIGLSIPNEWVVSETSNAAGPRQGRRRQIRSGVEAIAVPPSSDPVLDAIVKQGMTPLDTFSLIPPAAGIQRRSAAASENQAQIEVQLLEDEGAAILLVSEDVYSWHFPKTKPAKGRVGVRKVREGSPVGSRRVMFEIPIARVAKTGQKRRGILTEIAVGAIRAFVLKFVARIAVKGAMRHFESGVKKGIVLMEGTDPAKWAFVEDATKLILPADRPPRILLFIHGTFSSTVGSFGGLASTDWGCNFLEAARHNYDAVIGFDHATLSVDPLENATDLLDRLDKRKWVNAPTFDVVAYSRGGLVFRSVVEYLLPERCEWQGRFDRAVFVGATNAGTELAEPDNWEMLVDFYTNLSAGAARRIALTGVAGVAGIVLDQLVQSVGAFVKYLAIDTVRKDGIPGLAAMEPKGKFVQQLNKFQEGQPTPEKSNYYAVTSSFSAAKALGEAVTNTDLSGLPKQLLMTLAAGLDRQLMHEDNDLVVNTASMTAIDVSTGNYIKDKFDFGANGRVYHTVYFLQPEVVNSLVRWLRLAPPSPPGPSGGTPVTAGPVRSTLMTPPVPARADLDLLTVSSGARAADVRDMLGEKRPSYLVVRRPYKGRMLHYAFPADQAYPQLKSDSSTVLEALNLHESDRSPEMEQGSAIPKPRIGSRPTSRNVVMLHGSTPIGVIPESPTLDIATGARGAAATGTVDVAIRGMLQRRVMPTYMTSIPLKLAKPYLRVAPVAVSLAAAGIRPARIGSLRRGIQAKPKPIAQSKPQAAAAAVPEPIATPSQMLTCGFHAEMRQEVQVGKVTDVRVNVSREDLIPIKSAVSVTEKGTVDAGQKITIQVLAKSNVRNEGPDRVDIRVPEAGAPVELHFDVVPTDKGPGVVHVIARQGPLPIVTLVLTPQFVENDPKSTAYTENSASASPPEPLDHPIHELRIFERESGGKVFYQFELQSEELGLLDRFDSNFLVGNRENYINLRYKQIEERWLTTKGDTDAFQEELRAIGGQLWSELIPLKLQKLLWENRKKLKSVVILSSEPFIPWELVHFKEPDQPQLPAETLFLGQCGAVRWLYGAPFLPKKLRVRAGRSRSLIPDYLDPKYKLDETKYEKEFVEAAKNFGAIAVDPQPDAVRKLLAGPGAFDLLHFAGHGSAELGNISEAKLLLRGRMEKGEYVEESIDATTIGNFARLSDAGGSRPLVIINACQVGRLGYQLTSTGGLAKAFLCAGAGLFVAALWSVGDVPARKFVIEFYSQLLKGETVSDATIASREKARAEGEATWLAYVVYAHPNARLERV